jgi:hypothetical protein
MTNIFIERRLAQKDAEVCFLSLHNNAIYLDDTFSPFISFRLSPGVQHLGMEDGGSVVPQLHHQKENQESS